MQNKPLVLTLFVGKQKQHCIRFSGIWIHLSQESHMDIHGSDSALLVSLRMEMSEIPSWFSLWPEAAHF